MSKKYLLGATKEHEIVFGEFEITTRNGFPQFTASFDCVRPFDGDSVDLEKYFDDCAENYGKEYAYDLCERFHCAPQDLAKELANECNDVRDALDCSLYPNVITVNGTDYYFESSSCGQHDTREEMEEYTNRTAYDLLHQLWDNYHLKKVDEEIIEQVNELKMDLTDIDEEGWIANYIERHEEDFE